MSKKPVPLSEGGEPSTVEISAFSVRRQLRLVVFADETVGTHPLPQQGAVVIGRGEQSELRIDSPTLSRRHAVLHVGAEIEVEDLGSANGTFVGERRLEKGERVRVTLEDTLKLGNATATLQYYEPRGAQEAPRPAKIRTHEYFEARLDEECERAAESTQTFAVVRVSHRVEDAQAVLQVLTGAARPGDVVASFGPGEYEVLLAGPSATESATLVTKLEATSGVRAGVAIFPQDGLAVDALLAKAGARAHRGKAGGEAAIDDPFLARDPQMLRLRELVQRLAKAPVSVVILGETGAGKEVVAQALHRDSARAAKPFVALNCAAIPEQLLESELFGHERGAFTGALKEKVGLLESASGGTVFLDEIGEMALGTQAKLLRVMEQREVLRVGGLKPRPIDVRFVSATNRDLEAEAQRGTFRADLYFRLNGFTLQLPPLRERPLDIELFAGEFLKRISKDYGRPRLALSPEAIALLKSLPWPGNVRELRNVIERAVLLCTDNTITTEHLPAGKLRGSSPPVMGPVRPAAPSPPALAQMDDTTMPIEDERARIERALALHAGNQTLAAKALGISRRTLITRLEEYGISRPRKRGS